MKKFFALLLMLALLLSTGGCNRPQEMELTMLSQNLRIAADGGDNDVFLRVDRFAWLLEKYRPDVAGLQEYDPSWDVLLEEYLAELNYGIVFKYRGDHEATPIIYNKDKLELVSENFFWLSETPEVESPSWDDANGTRNRIVTECVFKDKETGIKFAHLNTHFGLTAYCQDESGSLINRYVKEHYTDMAVFVTGDFNTTENSQAYDNIVADEVLINAYYLAEEFGDVGGTFNGFNEGQTGSTIDFTFINHKVNTVYYSVLYDQPEGKFVSDHFGVLTKNIISR
ncbi:MAG: extracellular solute-binding protein [Clostridia bacterium]|nr:extracellular solute-binding protein [Clostridia bacterium]MBQ8893232.1 extracellular solute-binding protein [Clostridia bacterium]